MSAANTKSIVFKPLNRYLKCPAKRVKNTYSGLFLLSQGYRFCQNQPKEIPFSALFCTIDTFYTVANSKHPKSLQLLANNNRLKNGFFYQFFPSLLCCISFVRVVVVVEKFLSKLTTNVFCHWLLLIFRQIITKRLVGTYILSPNRHFDKDDEFLKKYLATMYQCLNELIFCI